VEGEAACRVAVLGGAVGEVVGGARAKGAAIEDDGRWGRGGVWRTEVR
jgi:hypothetical protein